METIVQKLTACLIMTLSLSPVLGQHTVMQDRLLIISLADHLANDSTINLNAFKCILEETKLPFLNTIQELHTRNGCFKVIQYELTYEYTSECTGGSLKNIKNIIRPSRSYSVIIDCEMNHIYPLSGFNQNTCESEAFKANQIRRILKKNSLR